MLDILQENESFSGKHEFVCRPATCFFIKNFSSYKLFLDKIWVQNKSAQHFTSSLSFFVAFSVIDKVKVVQHELQPY